MLTNERSVELAQNHVCAFSNTMDEEHRCLARSTKVVSTGLKVASLDRHLRLQAAAKAFVHQPVVDRRPSPRGNHTKGASALTKNGPALFTKPDPATRLRRG